MRSLSERAPQHTPAAPRRGARRADAPVFSQPRPGHSPRLRLVVGSLDGRCQARSRNQSRQARHRRRQDLWTLGSTARLEDIRRTAQLLPIYDEYLVSYRDRDAVPHGPTKVPSRSQGPVTFQHALILDGQVAGTWRVTRTLDRVSVEITPLRKLTSVARGTGSAGRTLQPISRRASGTVDFALRPAISDPDWLRPPGENNLSQCAKLGLRGRRPMRSRGWRSYAVAAILVFIHVGMSALGAIGMCLDRPHTHGGVPAPDCFMHTSQGAPRRRTPRKHSHHSHHDSAPATGSSRVQLSIRSADVLTTEIAVVPAGISIGLPNRRRRYRERTPSVPDVRPTPLSPPPDRRFPDLERAHVRPQSHVPGSRCV